MSIAPPSHEARQAAAAHLSTLAIPAGALGRLGDVAVWLSGVQDQVPPRSPENVRLVVFAGDHGVARHGVSAYPASVTPAMVRAFVNGVAGVSVLAQQNRVTVRVLDIAVDADLDDLGADVVAHKIRRGSGAIHLEDALTADETRRALEIGAAVAAEEIAAGADLLISGDMGIGNTTPAATLVAAALGISAADVVGRGTGIDDDALGEKTDVIATALERAGSRVVDPIDRLTALGSADIAASAGFMSAAAQAGVPVVLDGLISVAAAVTAERITPGAAAWFVAGHRSTEPAQSRALEKLGLTPLLDLGMRLGEGSGAVAAVPLVRSAARLMGQIARLDEVL